MNEQHKKIRILEKMIRDGVDAQVRMSVELDAHRAATGRGKTARRRLHLLIQTYKSFTRLLIDSGRSWRQATDAEKEALWAQAAQESVLELRKRGVVVKDEEIPKAKSRLDEEVEKFLIDEVELARPVDPAKKIDIAKVPEKIFLDSADILFVEPEAAG